MSIGGKTRRARTGCPLVCQGKDLAQMPSSKNSAFYYSGAHQLSSTGLSPHHSFYPFYPYQIARVGICSVRMSISKTKKSLFYRIYPSLNLRFQSLWVE